MGMIFALNLALPSMAAAQAGNNGNGRGLAQDNGTSTPPAGQNFCTRLSRLSGESETRFGGIGQKLKDKRDAYAAKMKEHRESATSTRATRLDAWMDKRDAALERLDAATGTQQAAVAKFKADMTVALAARKTAVDAAQQAFRAGIDKLHADRRTAEDKAIADYRAAVKAAFDKAKADCARNVDQETVKKALIAALEAAKAKLEAAKKALSPMGDKVKALVDTRRAAVKAAHDAFKATAEKARAELKAALRAARDSATNTSATGTSQ